MTVGGGWNEREAGQDRSYNSVLPTPVSPSWERYREGVFAIQLTKTGQLPGRRCQSHPTLSLIPFPFEYDSRIERRFSPLPSWERARVRVFWVSYQNHMELVLANTLLHRSELRPDLTEKNIRAIVETEHCPRFSKAPRDTLKSGKSKRTQMVSETVSPSQTLSYSQTLSLPLCPSCSPIDAAMSPNAV